MNAPIRPIASNFSYDGSQLVCHSYITNYEHALIYCAIFCLNIKKTQNTTTLCIFNFVQYMAMGITINLIINAYYYPYEICVLKVILCSEILCVFIW